MKKEIEIVNSFKSWFLNFFKDIDFEELNNLLKIDFYLINEVGENYVERFNEIYFLKILSEKCSNELNYLEHLMGPENYLILKYNNMVYRGEQERLKYFYMKFSITLKKIQIYFTNFDKNNFDLKVVFFDFYNVYNGYLEFLLKNEFKIIEILEKESIKVLNNKKEEKFESSIFN
jgi:hypothetical protein